MVGHEKNKTNNNSFLNHFHVHWLSSNEIIPVQNAHEIDENHLKLKNRESNDLENHNGRMSNKFTCVHPHVIFFVESLEEEDIL